MTSDVFKFNAIVDDIGHNLAELADLEKNGTFQLSSPMAPTELAELIGGPPGTWQPQNQDIVWFNALKLTVYARYLLAQSAQLLVQCGDSASARKTSCIVDSVDEQFHPGETDFRVYARLLGGKCDS